MPRKTIRGSITTTVVSLFSFATLVTGGVIAGTTPNAKNASCHCEVNQTAEPAQYFEIKQGQNASLLSLSNLLPGGTWVSQLGSVSQAGVYSAPNFFHTGLTDEIQYWADGNLVYSTKILIKKDTNMPVRGLLPVAANYGADNESLVFAAQLPSDESWHEVIEPGHQDEPTPTPTLCDEIVAETLAASTDQQTVGTAVETQIGDVTTFGIGVQGTTFQLQQAQKCKVKGPLYPNNPDKPTGPCIPGATKKVFGPLHSYVKPLGPFEDNGEISVSASLAALIKKLFTIEIKVDDKKKVRSRPIDWVQIQHGDKYVCGANGQWSYAGSFTCTRQGLGVEAIPSYGTLLLGFHSNGSPHHWRPWACAPL